MSRYNSLRKIIQARLESVHSRVYYEEADPEAALPRVTFLLATDSEREHRADVILEVTLWGGSTAAEIVELENLADSIDDALDRHKHIDNVLQASFYRMVRLAVADPDPRLRRRELRYTVKTYFVG